MGNKPAKPISSKPPQSELNTRAPVGSYYLSSLNAPTRVNPENFGPHPGHSPSIKNNSNFPCRSSSQCSRRFKTAVARKHHEVSHGELPLPPGAKMVNNPKVYGRLDPGKSLQFIKEINELPIYYISAHSCICPKKFRCFGEYIEPTFILNKNTYIISMSQPDDGVKIFADAAVHKNIENFRMFLYLHGVDDFAPSPEVGRTHYSFFSGFQRATGPHTPYPNIVYTFNEKDEMTGRVLPPYENPYGVYDLSKPLHPTNNNSIIPQDPARENWTLENIIDTVFKATGKNKGIFINGGCLTACYTMDKENARYSAEKQKASRESIADAGNLMQKAETLYKTDRPVLTAEDLIKLQMSRTREPTDPLSIAVHYVAEENEEAGLYPKKEGGGTRKKRRRMRYYKQHI
jgi:hypothetical protein